MYKKDKDIIFKVAPTYFVPSVQLFLFLVAGLSVLFGPFIVTAKMIFCPAWCCLGFYYYMQCVRQRSYSQLRFSNGNLLLIFRNGQEPQLVHFCGSQRILPWLVELNLKLENGRVIHWGISFDTMDADSFRQLKVFVQTRVDQLQSP